MRLRFQKAYDFENCKMKRKTTKIRRKSCKQTSKSRVHFSQKSWEAQICAHSGLRLSILMKVGTELALDCRDSKRFKASGSYVLVPQIACTNSDESSNTLGVTMYARMTRRVASLLTLVHQLAYIALLRTALRTTLNVEKYFLHGSEEVSLRISTSLIVSRKKSRQSRTVSC